MRTAYRRRSASLAAALEGLEARRLFANDPLTVGVFKVGSAVWLSVVGTAADDAIVVTRTSATAYTIANGTWSLARAGTFAGVRVAAGAGNDSVGLVASIAMRVSLLGEAGNDTLAGGAANDVLNGGVGDDSLNGDAGNDTLTGDLGNDTLLGGAGNDSLTGGAGNDSLDGGADDDRLIGDAGGDAYLGGAGADALDFTARAVPLTITLDGQANDGAVGEAANVGDDLETIFGGRAADSITGSAGANVLNGGAGNDTIDGAAGDDKIYGGAGADSLSGGDGDDYVYGQTDNDRLFGNDGKDLLEGGAGNDQSDGGAGRDRLIAIGGGKLDTVTGGDGLDSFWLDSDVTEQVTDVDGTETTARAVHRVKAFVTTRGASVSKEIAGQKLVDPGIDPRQASLKPKIANFANRPLFADGGPSADDIGQGSAGDCWYLSSLSAFAKVAPETLRQAITELGDGSYAVRFYNTTTLAEQYVRVDADLYTYSWSSTYPLYARAGTNGSLWAPLLEKALTWVHGRVGTYASIYGGWMGSATVRMGLTDVAPATPVMASASSIATWLHEQLDAGRAVTIGTIGTTTAGLIGGHAYMVDQVTDNGDGTFALVLRNPWGVDGNNIDGVNDGYVTVTSVELFANCSGVSAAA